ncbi:hypothetical protein IG631_02313 [Alternaria alternata]|nr:hypothetical protein IG631_02313 [Alternaria alternata]
MDGSRGTGTRICCGIERTLSSVAVKLANRSRGTVQCSWMQRTIILGEMTTRDVGCIHRRFRFARIRTPHHIHCRIQRALETPGNAKRMIARKIPDCDICSLDKGRNSGC